MDTEETAVAEELQLDGVAQKLRRAREGMGLDLAQVAAETRIPIRHLEVIERGAFEELPAPTYAVGFSRTYAKMVGLDEKDIAREVRAEISVDEEARRYERVPTFEPGDPAKVPSAGLAWAGAIGAILLFSGAAMYYSTFYGAGAGPAPLVAEPQPEPALANAGEIPNLTTTTMSTMSSSGQVVFTALEDGVWVRFYDVDGQRLLEKQMASGERFEIPNDASEPRINTGRPDAFAITIDGQPVPKLANEPRTVGDMPVSAGALLARADTPDAAQLN